MDLKSLMRSSFPQERLLAGYLIAVALLLLLFGEPIPDRVLRATWHIALAAVILLLVPRLGETGWMGAVRHWLPIALLATVYTELDVLNDMFTATFHDEWVIGVEQSIFGVQVAVALRQWLPYRVLSEYLHLGYFSYYFLFIILGIPLYVKGRLAEFRYAATVTLSAFLICYTIYIFFPVGGPWNTFVRPALAEVGYVMPPLVHSVLIKGESVGTAFPSSHVVVALTVWLLAYRLHRQVFYAQAFLVPALVIATMYGGFHYAIDVAVAVPLAIAIFAAGPAINRALGGGDLPLRVRGEVASVSPRRRNGSGR